VPFLSLASRVPEVLQKYPAVSVEAEVDLYKGPEIEHQLYKDEFP